MVSPLRLAVLGCAASVVLLVAPVASAATSERGPGVRGPITVGYSSEVAPAASVSRAGGRVLRRLPRIRVAEVSGSGRLAELLAGSPGISFLERPATRTPAAEPGLAQANMLGAFEWQYAATHADVVPESVLRAASEITIAVIDTGADLGAPDLAAKSPFAFDIAHGRATSPTSSVTAPSSRHSRRAPRRTARESPASAVTRTSLS